jgi:hypothetical protein
LQVDISDSLDFIAAFQILHGAGIARRYEIPRALSCLQLDRVAEKIAS